MQPTGPVTPNLSQLLGMRAPSGESPRLQIGQTLMAQVVKTDPGQATLRVGQQLLQAQTGQLKLTPGETLQLQVAQLGKLPVLRVIAQVQQNMLAQAMRQTLPQQQPLPQTLANLAQTLGSAAARQLPPQVMQLARDVIGRLPDAIKVSTPDGLKQSIRDSGTFLEARLVQPGQTALAQQANLQGDLKANLMRLAQALRQHVTQQNAQTSPGARASAVPASSGATPAPATGTTTQTSSPLVQPPLPGTGRESDIVAAMRRDYPPRPQPSVAMRALAMTPLLRAPELLAQVESAVSRIKLNQLASTPQAERPQLAEWLIELPVRRNDEMLDLWALRIARDRAQRNADGSEGLPQWTVTLAFDLPGLGPMQSRVTLQGKDRLTAIFMSETGGALPLINEHLPMLQARLEQAGLQVDSLSCHHGCLPEPVRKPNERDGILDEKA